MDTQTFFATPMRTPAEDIAREAKKITQSPLVQEILRDVGGLISVLDKNRQIIAANDQVFSLLEAKNLQEILGCRPGEAIGCVHADKAPNGCGTGKLCQSCGAVLAIVSSQLLNTPVEKNCLLSLKGEKDALSQDLVFRVRASPLSLGGQDYTLLFLQDISAEKRREALEHTFFHDLKNGILSISGMVDLLASEKNAKSRKEITELLTRASDRLVEEVRIQQVLMDSSSVRKSLHLQDFPLNDVVHDLQSNVSRHPSAKRKKLTVSPPSTDLHLNSDRVLVERVIENMLINAFDATPQEGIVKLMIAGDADSITFTVWNRQPIPDHVKPRIFQRFFSTKEESGHGLGTYGMKLIGEQCLGGNVYFQSSIKDGTTFTFSLPCPEK